MNTPSPLVPQGSLLEQKKKRRTRVLFTVMGIIALHVIPITALLLMQGCKRDTGRPELAATDATNNFLPPIPGGEFYTNYPPADSNATATTTTPSTPITPPGHLEPVPPLAAPATASEYTVLKGDSFSRIGKKHGVTAAAIAAANPGVDSTKLKIGQKLLVPPASPKPAQTGVVENSLPSPADTGQAVHVVKSGESLSKIARQHGTTIRAIRDANNLRTDRILVGQKLKVPAGKAPGKQQETAPPTTPAANRLDAEDVLRNAISVPEPELKPAAKPTAGAV
ncbi:MAG: LysM peptidoglycan-binding domain-containing protein [Verrucomicrobia bacterium]|nr:LysM peptidoglycan-binding domain-containing protein [Verrucomicrobiota bacterium]